MELSIGEMLVVALVIVVLFGPDKIPSIARELGQGVRKMKGAMEDIKTEIMKEADNPISDIKKEIDKLSKKYQKNPYLAEIMEMRKPEFLATLDSLYQKLDEQYGEDYVSKVRFRDKFFTFLNNLLNELRINYQFKVSISKMNEIEKQIHNLKKWYHYKKPIDNKFVALNEKYDDLDYDISY